MLCQALVSVIRELCMEEVGFEQSMKRTENHLRKKEKVILGGLCRRPTG